MRMDRHPAAASRLLSRLSASACFALASYASADFTNFEVEATSAGDSTRYVVYARFSGPTDTLLNAFHITLVDGGVVAFHQDLLSPTKSSGVGTWNPLLSIAGTPDSYTTIGGGEGISSGNSTAFDPDWGAANANQPQIPFGNFKTGPGWFNQNPPNLQGRVDATGRVKVAQFLLADCTLGATIFLKVGYNDGAGSAALYGEATFELGGGANCNGNGVNDACEIADGSASDCNGNAIPDSCDIADGLETDLNGNSVADSCEFVVGGSGYATIAEAIAAAPPGAEIDVAPGVYAEALSFTNSVILRSIDGAASTVLDGSGIQDAIVRVVGADTSGSVIDGFTFQNGSVGALLSSGVRAGGAIYLRDCSALVRNCVFTGNSAEYAGAIYGYNFSGTVSNCSFLGNSAAIDAGATSFVLAGDWFVEGCVYSGNSAGRYGGAAYSFWSASASGSSAYRNCEFRNNSAPEAGSAIGYFAASGQLALEGCVVEENGGSVQ